MRHLRRSGLYLRVADPAWSDPLSPKYAHQRGGRWNPPHSFGVVYLNASLGMARAQVRHRLEARGIRPEDLALDRGPVLVRTHVPDARYVDAVTRTGLRALGLPDTYPLDDRRQPIPHTTCQSIGQRAWDASEPGIACRSALRVAPADGEELAFFARRRRLGVESVRAYSEWYW